MFHNLHWTNSIFISLMDKVNIFFLDVDFFVQLKKKWMGQADLN